MASGGVTLFQPGAIDNYLGGHRGFVYEPSAEISVLKAFKRLAISQGWGDKKKEQEKKKFYAAVDTEFGARVGSGFNLTEWQRLAKFIGIEPLPVTITQCKKMIKKENINIYQILKAYRKAQEVKNIDLIKPCPDIQRFKSTAELRKYTQKHNMYFPKQWAKGSVLKGLLKELR
ncbi:hypothetical protein H072_2035 [Dactylellina haptotyla CBS 200.50]|uniref:Uncharacterized protein n=1 Tax=Dactylellina haptotyla (strain CBS 200.50) TaxID=1284197 RepID=S8ALS1_DACHA|nr:hypothetical protein H072_2035 [Dactylellina haptotyla CBS 200.50]